MTSEWEWMQRLMPEMGDKLLRRFNFLQSVHQFQPVGRRTLAAQLTVSERTVRSETDVLCQLGLIVMTRQGMSTTDQGEAALRALAPSLQTMVVRPQMEQALAQRLKIAHCSIVPGDFTGQTSSIGGLAQAAVQVLHTAMPLGKNTVAVMGGRTMAAVAEAMTPALSERRDLLFVPARGGVGERPTIQANTISARMAEQTGSRYRSLFIPEQLTAQTYRPLLAEPAIKAVLKLIRECQVVVHGIGDALTMAKRRQMPTEVQSELLQVGAVGEAFGYFFDQKGQVVYKIPRIGLAIDDLDKKVLIVAVAGGRDKAAAIEAYMRLAPPQTWLITDEGAADIVLNK